MEEEGFGGSARRKESTSKTKTQMGEYQDQYQRNRMGGTDQIHLAQDNDK